jgi:hypothetical protein
MFQPQNRQPSLSIWNETELQRDGGVGEREREQIQDEVISAGDRV